MLVVDDMTREKLLREHVFEDRQHVLYQLTPEIVDIIVKECALRNDYRMLRRCAPDSVWWNDVPLGISNDEWVCKYMCTLNFPLMLRNASSKIVCWSVGALTFGGLEEGSRKRRVLRLLPHLSHQYGTNRMTALCGIIYGGRCSMFATSDSSVYVLLNVVAYI